MRKNRFVGQDRCYHLISRLAHRAFFLDDEEKDRAVALMRRVEEFSGVVVLAYAFLSNHFHIFVYVPKAEEIDEAEVMRRIEHSGTMFEGRCRERNHPAERPTMWRTSAYIDINAWEAGIAERPEDYRWCSFAAAAGGDREAVGIRSRVHFSRCYMTPLVEKGLVARTDPDKPMSPRQEYKLA